MGKKIEFKEMNAKNLEKQGETFELSNKMYEEASEIDALIESIDDSMDSDDLQAVKNLESGYKNDFNSEFQNEVESRGDEIAELANDTIEGGQEEADKTISAQDILNSAKGVSDIGRGNADGGIEKMKDSQSDYENSIESASDIKKDTEKEISSKKVTLDNLFD